MEYLSGKDLFYLRVAIDDFDDLSQMSSSLGTYSFDFGTVEGICYQCQ